MDNLNQLTMDSRFTIDEQIKNLFGSAFEDFGMDGIRYVASEVFRISEGLEKQNKEGRLL